jgi:hypothetical protein
MDEIDIEFAPEKAPIKLQVNVWPSLDMAEGRAPWPAVLVEYRRPKNGFTRYTRVVLNWSLSERRFAHGKAYKEHAKKSDGNEALGIASEVLIAAQKKGLI